MAAFALALTEEGSVDAAAPAPKVTWGTEGATRFVVVTGMQPYELVSSVLKRAKLTVTTAKALKEPDYVLKIQGRGGTIKSRFWKKKKGGEYAPDVGIPCLKLELGEWDPDTKTWQTTASPVFTALLKTRVPDGFAIRISQVGFDYGQMVKSKFGAFIAKARSAVSELRPAMG